MSIVSCYIKENCCLLVVLQKDQVETLGYVKMKVLILKKWLLLLAPLFNEFAPINKVSINKNGRPFDLPFLLNIS